jgi:hypothetical protein
MRKYRRFIDPEIEALLDTRVNRRTRRTLRRAIQIAYRAGGCRYLFEQFAVHNRQESYKDLARTTGLTTGEIYRMLKFHRSMDGGAVAVLLFTAHFNRAGLKNSFTKDCARKFRAACFTRAAEAVTEILGIVPDDANNEAVVLEDDAALLLSAIELLPLEFLMNARVDQPLKDQQLLKKIIKRTVRYTPQGSGSPEILHSPDPAGYLQHLLVRYGHPAFVAYIALQNMWSPESRSKSQVRP